MRKEFERNKDVSRAEIKIKVGVETALFIRLSRICSACKPTIRQIFFKDVTFYTYNNSTKNICLYFDG